MERKISEEGLPFGLFCGTAMLLVSCWFSWYAITETIEDYELSKWQPVECDIISSKTFEGDDGRFEVSYRYKWQNDFFKSDCYNIRCDANDVSYSKAVELAGKYKAGEKALCYVNPDEPNKAVLSRDGPASLGYFITPLFLLIVGTRQIYLGFSSLPKSSIVESSEGGTGRICFEAAKSSGIGAKIWKYLTVIGFIIALGLNFPLVFLVSIFLYLASAALAKHAEEMKQKLIKIELDAGGETTRNGTVGVKVHFTTFEKTVFAVSLVLYLLIMILIVKNLNRKDFFFLFGIIFNGLWLGLFMSTVVWMIISTMHGYHYLALQEREKQAGLFKFDLPVWSLLVSNIIIIVWALVERWSFYMILWIYWGQSISIGLFILIRALVTNDVGALGKRKKTFKTLSFLFIYALFHCVYVFLLKGFFKDVKLEPNFHLIIALAVGIFFVQQIIAFVYDSIKGSGRANIDDLIGLAGLRIIPMHLTIMGAGFLSMAAALSIESPVMLILFLGLKSFADVGMCLYTRKDFSRKMDAIFK
jgi:uncharacterized integral membrane protein